MVNKTSYDFQIQNEALIDTLLSLKYSMMIEGKNEGIMGKLKYSLNLLKNFQGFNGCGYFHLGKSLICALFVNFVTFTVILVQFKLSDSL